MPDDDPAPRDDPSPRRAALADLGTGAVLAIAGLVVGVIAVAYATDAPIGAVVAFAGNAVLGLLGGWGLRGWRGALWPTGGWLIAVIVLSLPRSEGDVLLPSTATVQVFLIAGALGAVVAAVVSLRFQPPREASPRRLTRR